MVADDGDGVGVGDVSDDVGDDDDVSAGSKCVRRYIVTPPPAAHPDWRGTST